MADTYNDEENRENDSSPSTNIQLCLVSYIDSNDPNEIFPVGEILYKRGKKWKSCTSDYVSKFLMNPNQFDTLRIRHEDDEQGAIYRKINIVAWGRK